MTRPTIAQLRDVSQPKDHLGRVSGEHWLGPLLHRKISIYITWLVVPTRITPNGVTWIFILTGILGGLCLLIPGIPGAFLALLLIQLQAILDCSDGELARWRRTSSPAGIFLDSIGHYSGEAVICLALGIRAAGGFGEPSWYMLAGGFIAVMVMFNRAMNEMVGSARLKAGLPKMVDAAGGDYSSTAPRGAVAKLKRFARFFPLHRSLHALEFTMIIFVAAIGDAILGDLSVTRWLVILLVPGTVIVCAGHLASILASGKLKAVKEAA